MLKEKQTVIKLQRIFLKNYICAGQKNRKLMRFLKPPGFTTPKKIYERTENIVGR